MQEGNLALTLPALPAAVRTTEWRRLKKSFKTIKSKHSPSSAEPPWHSGSGWGSPACCPVGEHCPHFMVTTVTVGQFPKPKLHVPPCMCPQSRVPQPACAVCACWTVPALSWCPAGPWLVPGLVSVP